MLSVSTVVDVLAASGAPLTARQVRHAGAVSSYAGSVGARLFTVDDVVVLALYAHLLRRTQAAGLPRWTALAAVRYGVTDIRRAVARRAAAWVLVDPVHGRAWVSAVREPKTEAIDLRALRDRVRAAVAAHRMRTAQETIWIGTHHVPRQEIAAWVTRV